MPADPGRTFLALADPTRRAVIRMLSGRPRRSGDIAAALATSRPAMSRHLRVLRRAGLVEEELLPEDARVHVYRLRQQPFAELRRWLDEVEAFWGQQLGAFKVEAERRGRPLRR